VPAGKHHFHLYFMDYSKWPSKYTQHGFIDYSKWLSKYTQHGFIDYSKWLSKYTQHHGFID
jgi:hypothetical protein